MRRSTLVPVLVALVALLPAGAARAADLHATTATFSTVYAGASGGDRILLAAGSYSLVNPAKSPAVTLTPDTGVSTSAVSVDVTGADSYGLVLDGVTVPDFEAEAGTYHDLRIQNSDVTGFVILKFCGSANADIVLDGNTHDGQDPTAYYEGRISFPGAGSGACGVTIRNSEFSGGCADGIATGAQGVQILDNEFTDILQSCSTDVAHTDAIQLYGSSETHIEGNYLHDVETCIMAPDGPDHELIQNNVCVTAGTGLGITLGSDDSSTVRHNTVIGTGLRLMAKDGMPTPTGTIVRDNVLSNISEDAGSVTIDHNLFPAASSPNVDGSPTFTGGSTPATFAGYALTSLSAGHAGASDGSDIGIDVTPPDTTITSGPASSTTSTSASFAFTATEAGSAFECQLDGGAYGSCTSPKAYSSLAVGSHTFSVRATDAAGNTDATPATATWTITASITAPTYIGEAEVSWSTTTASKTTSSFAVQAGDVLVAYGMSEDTPDELAISGGSLTWTQRQRVDESDYGPDYVWTATVDTTKSMTVTITRTSGLTEYGGDVLIFRGSGGIGASAQAHDTGAPSLSLTTTQANSAIVVAAVDWNAVSGSSRTWRTGAGALTETSYFTHAGHYTIFGGLHAGAGAAGAKTVGLTAPAGQQYSIVAIEVKGI
jgi:hypothetical protein